MGQNQNLKGSSKIKIAEKKDKEGDEEEQKEDKKEAVEEEIEQPRKSAEEVEEEFKFGEQLQDDVINTFCDRLQAVCPQRIEAMLAMQFLMISEPAEIKKHVSGKKMALQVIYDTTRKHYVLLHFDPKHQHIVLYDSLQPFDSEGTPQIITEVAKQIGNLFGHLFLRYIPILIDKEYELQIDNFSCGYRCIGALVDLARQRNPAQHKYSRTAILKFLKAIINEPFPTWKMFENVKFGKTREYSGEKRTRVHIVNSQWNGSTTTTSSTRTAPMSSRSSSTASVCERRAPAGRDHSLHHVPPAHHHPEHGTPSPRPLSPSSPPISPNDAFLNAMIPFKLLLLSFYHNSAALKACFRFKKAEKEKQE